MYNVIIGVTVSNQDERPHMEVLSRSSSRRSHHDLVRHVIPESQTATRPPGMQERCGEGRRHLQLPIKLAKSGKVPGRRTPDSYNQISSGRSGTGELGVRSHFRWLIDNLETPGFIIAVCYLSSINCTCRCPYPLRSSKPLPRFCGSFSNLLSFEFH